MAGDDPIPGIVHGEKGYKKGCRCFTCRRGHAAALEEYRSRRRANGGKKLSDVPPEDRPPSTGGRVERRVRDRITALGLKTEEAAMFEELALMTAQMIDKIPEDGRWHLLGSAQQRLLDVMDRLTVAAGVKQVRKVGDDEEDDFLDGLRKPGQP